MEFLKKIFEKLKSYTEDCKMIKFLEAGEDVFWVSKANFPLPKG